MVFLLNLNLRVEVNLFFLSFSWKMGLNSSSKWQLNEIIYERLQNVTFSALITACYVFVHQSIESLCALPARQNLFLIGIANIVFISKTYGLSNINVAAIQQSHVLVFSWILALKNLKSQFVHSAAQLGQAFLFQMYSSEVDDYCSRNLL